MCVCIYFDKSKSDVVVAVGEGKGGCSVVRWFGGLVIDAVVKIRVWSTECENGAVAASGFHLKHEWSRSTEIFPNLFRYSDFKLEKFVQKLNINLIN